MERTIYCGVELFCFQYQCCKTFPLHCFLGWPCFIQFDSVFQPLKIYTNNNTDFCLHSTYNIKSKALANQPPLLRATAGGRCGKKPIKGGGNYCSYQLYPGQIHACCEK